MDMSYLIGKFYRQSGLVFAIYMYITLVDVFFQQNITAIHIVWIWYWKCFFFKDEESLQ